MLLKTAWHAGFRGISISETIAGKPQFETDLNKAQMRPGGKEAAVFPTNLAFEYDGLALIMVRPNWGA